MVGGGTFSLFWDEPVSFLLDYLNHRVQGLGYGGSSAPLWVKISDLAPLLMLNIGAFIWTAVGLRGWRPVRTRTGMLWFGYVAVWAMPIVAAVATLLVVWPVY